MRLNSLSLRQAFSGIVSALAALVVLASTDFGHASPVTITNFSFEDQVPTVTMYEEFTPPVGWTYDVADGLNRMGVNNTTWSNPNYGYPLATNGTDIAFVGDTNGLGTYLLQEPTTISSHTVYTLKVDVGGPPSLPGSQYDVALVDGTTGLTILKDATGVATTANLSTVTVTYDSPNSNPLAGDQLGIQVTLSGLGVSGGQILFDNVRLDAQNVPEPSALGLMLLAVALLAGRKLVWKSDARHFSPAFCALGNRVMRSKLILVLIIVSLMLTGALVSTSHAALITFSGLHNGITTATDPEETVTTNPIPSNYQPLQNAYPAPGGGVDGANIGVSITWSATALVAEFPDNNTVDDHTHQVTPADTAYENALTPPNSIVSMIFSAPVNVPSLWFGYDPSAGATNTTFSAYTHAGDATPAVTFTQGYPGSGGTINWQEVTGFGNTPVQEISFAVGGAYFQLDDITVTQPVPEPSTLCVSLIGAVLSLGWLGCKRARSRQLANQA